MHSIQVNELYGEIAIIWSLEPDTKTRTVLVKNISFTLCRRKNMFAPSLLKKTTIPEMDLYVKENLRFALAA